MITFFCIPSATFDIVRQFGIKNARIFGTVKPRFSTDNYLDIYILQY